MHANARPDHATNKCCPHAGTVMVLRHVSPLNHEDWVAFLEALKKGPSPEKKRAIQAAMEKAKHLTAPCEDC